MILDRPQTRLTWCSAGTFSRVLTFLLCFICIFASVAAPVEQNPTLADTIDWQNKDDYRKNAMFRPLDVSRRKLPPGYVDLVSQLPKNKQIQSNAITSKGGAKALPVYVSLTTISSRQEKALKTIVNLLRGSVRPTHIYLMISSQPFLIDEGIPEHAILPGLMNLAILYPQQFSIVYTDNIGPHRKLLPLLAKMWREDVLIITMDDESQTQDHTATTSLVVESLLNYFHISQREDVVALRARRIGVCRAFPHKLLSYMFWPVVAPLRREMLLMPTGTGGILYRPKFFHPVVFDQNLRHATKLADDLMFRMATIAKNVYVTIGCMSVPRRNRYCPSLGRVKLDETGSPERRAMFKAFNSSMSLSPAQRMERLSNDSEKKTEKVKKFPAFWGPPPEKQTRDRVTLPAGYGSGSSTLRDWIDMKLADEDVDDGEEGGSRGDGAGGEAGDGDRFRRQLPGGEGSRRQLRAKPTTLYQINARGGNDHAWRNASDYLASKGLVNIRSALLARVKPERRYCLPEYWRSLMESDPQYKAGLIPSPVRSCALKKCKSENDFMQET